MVDAKQYIPLVYKIAREGYKKFGFRYEYKELFQVGCIGLMQAVNRFDESKGYGFLTYACPVIRGTIHNYIRGDAWYMAPNCKTRLKGGQEPVSLDVKLGDNIRETRKDCLPYKEQGFSKVEMEMVIDTLPPKQREVIRMYYLEGLMPREISRKLGISESAMFLRRDKGLKLLRKELEA